MRRLTLFLAMSCGFSAFANPVRYDVKIPVEADLKMASGVSFDFNCRNASAFSGFTCYLSSGNGCYVAPFAPSLKGTAAECINVLRRDVRRIEGEVAGWEKINRITITGWKRGGVSDKDAVFECKGLKPLTSGDLSVVIVAGDSCVPKLPSEGSGFTGAPAKMSKLFAGLGISHQVLSDYDLSDGLLAKTKIVALPYNICFPEGKMQVLERYAKRGGRFYSYGPPRAEVARLVGIEPSKKWVCPKIHRVPAFGGYLREGIGVPDQPEFVPQHSWNASIPELGPGIKVLARWATRDGKSLEYPAIVESSRGIIVSHSILETDPFGPSAELVCALMGALNPELGAKLAKSRPQRDAAKAARDPALCAEPSKGGEFRAISMHTAFGLGGDWNWEDTVRFVKKNGFTCVKPNFAWGGGAYYNSKVLPVLKDVKERGDMLKACLEACRRHGIDCYAWKVCWKIPPVHTPKEFGRQMMREGRVQKSYSGKVFDSWLCPTHPANQNLEIEAFAELARKGVDGLSLDYIRYYSEDYCFCDGCRKRFEARIGKKIEKWPSDVRKNPVLRTEWHNFRKEAIDFVVRRISEEARKVSPRIQILAATFRDPEKDPETVGQNWVRWCKEGWVDSIAPMNYTASPELFREMLKIQTRAVGANRILPGIGASDWPAATDDAFVFAAQLRAVREAGCRGFGVFELDWRGERVLPLLRLGPTAPAKETLRFAAWNIGHFSNGIKTKSRIPLAKANETAKKYQELISDVAADVFGVAEYSRFFDMEETISATDTLFGDFRGKISGYDNGGHYNSLFVKNADVLSSYAKNFKVCYQGTHFVVAKIKKFGKEIALVMTHLEPNWPRDHTDKRAAQMRQMIEALKGEKYVIIGGDFNVKGGHEYAPLLEAGYAMQNDGSIFTYSAAKPRIAIDNFFVKGLRGLGFKSLARPDLSDHCLIVCDFELED